MPTGTEPTSRVSRGGRRSTRARLLLGVALVAVLAGVTAYALGAWAQLEDTSVDLRFSLRPVQRPRGLLIVAVDNNTLNAVPQRWPFPRSLDARAVDVLRADHARTIVYDVQFTQPTSPPQDLSLYNAIARAGNVVLATTEIGPQGETNVLGGDANLARAHARAAAANFRANSSGVIQRYAYAVGGLRTLAVAAAEQTTGRRLAPGAFDHGSAWIDFPGPVGTIPSVSFSDLVRGRVDPALVAGRIIVIGATSPILQDIHSTSVTASTGMSGPEVQADAISTALRGNPLRPAPGWLAVLAIVLGGALAPLSCLRMRPGKGLAVGLLFAAAYLLLAQAAFDANLILVVSYPLMAAALGVLGALLVSYLAETWERRLADRYGAVLQDTVRARTAELAATQLEVINRLARAAELRDEDTGLHIERVGRICEKLALRAGMSGAEAERLRIASALHDVGKIGVPDRVLLKRGELDPDEWELMKTHTSTGAELLAGSSSALLQMAETIALTHHERWDGSGYPAGLSAREIPLAGRICAICDVFDALSARRSYKEPWPFDAVVKEIVRKSGSHFDPELVQAFLEIIDEFKREHALAASSRGAAGGRGQGELPRDGGQLPAHAVPAR